MDGIVAGLLHCVADLWQGACRSTRRLRGRVQIAALGVGLAAATNATAAGAPAPYQPIAPPLTTPWTGSVSTVTPWPQYPRPQLERSRWQSLNGRWQYETTGSLQTPPFGQTLAQTILVPFAPESALSGIGREDELGWYRRTFTVPAAWGHDHVVLNFGAVAWAARVYVNGHLVEDHHGDYDAFSSDITPFLKRRGENELVVGFYDPIGSAGEPVGKQVPGAPSGIVHTAVSGIWQTVWLEPVAAQHIAGLELTPDLTHSELVALPTVQSSGPSGHQAKHLTLTATALAGGKPVATATASPGRRLVLRIPHPTLWSPWRPYLYGLRLQLLAGQTVLDTVTSYFGMRSISLGRVGGATRILLNGKFVFQAGALDQGYWPDGIYTPPTDAAIQFDISAAKQMGFDMLREHEKVQPDRWYYWADRLGLLVWQDMPSLSRLQTSAPSSASQAEFRRELDRIVVQHRSDPSIVMWVPFNEGWNEFDPAGVTAEIEKLDAGALVDADSGSADCCLVAESPRSQVNDTHLYSGPFAVDANSRASVIGEFGGAFPYPPPADRWPGQLYSVGLPAVSRPFWDAQELLRAQYDALGEEMRIRGLSGAVLTEFANYEQELGILSYDRRVYTLSPGLLHALNAKLIAQSQRPEALWPQSAGVPGGINGSWSFAEGQGSTAQDSVSPPLPLTLEGGAGWTSGPRLRGRPTGALAISAAGQDAVTSAPVIQTSQSFTVSAWLKPGAGGESGTAVSEPGPDGSSFSLGIQTIQRNSRPMTWWAFTVPAGSACPATQCGVRANLRYSDGRNPPSPGHWYLVTGVYDQATQSIALYVNGIPQDIEHVTAVPADQGPLTVGEGSGDYAPTDSFLGAIAGLRTWGRALTPAEVWQLYTGQVS